MQSCNRSVKKVYTCIHARARRKIFLHISLPNIVKLFSICNMAKFKKFKKKIFFFFFYFIYIYFWRKLVTKLHDRLHVQPSPKYRSRNQSNEKFSKKIFFSLFGYKIVTNGYIGYKLIFCSDFPFFDKKKGALNINSLHIF